MGFWALTCDFLAVFEKNKCERSVASSFGLRSGVTPQRARALVGEPRLRQSGDAFGVAFYGTRERVPFRFWIRWVRSCPSVWVLMVCRDRGKSRSLRDDNKKGDGKNKKATTKTGRQR